MSNKQRTEHAGAKHTGTGYYGTHQNAKRVCSKLRRRIGKRLAAEID